MASRTSMSWATRPRGKPHIVAGGLQELTSLWSTALAVALAIRQP
jgi:hypothetical protein